MTNNSYIIKCKDCGTKNRVPAEKLKNHPICGKCRSPLPTDSVYDHPIDITDQSFDSEVISFKGTVLVDCWAPWCGPCRMVGPIMDQLAKVYAGQVKIVKLNVDENPVISSKFNVQSVPTLLLFKNGTLVNTLLGAQPRHEIEKHLKLHL